MATLDPEFDRRLRALLTAGGEAGYNPQVASGYRSPEDQARAVDSVSRNVNGRPASFVEFSRGIPGYAAPVGASMHQRGQAADLTGNGVDWTRQNAADYGIRFPESLRGTDPNHAEIDPKFWGPVQDPRDRAATMAAAQAEPQAPGLPAQPMMARVPVEIPASKGGIGPNGTPNPPRVAPQVAGYQARDPRMSLGRAPQSEQGGGLLGGIAKFATNTFTNPLFQAGAAMVNAGSQGRNVGGGFLEGANAAAIASQRQQEEAKRARELASEQNRAALWNDMVTNPNPAWARDIGQPTIELARAMGPVDGIKLILDTVQKNQVGQLDRMKLDETRRKNDISASTAQAQILEAQNMNNERRDMMRSQTELRRQQMQQEAAAARRRAELLGEPPPAAPAAPVQPRPVPPPVNPNLKRMSDEQPAEDQMLIQTQAVTPPDAPAQSPAQDPTRMVQTTRGPMAPQDARAYGNRLLVDPELRALGQSYIKQADAIDEKGALATGARGDLQKSAIGDVNHLARLNDIAATYNDNYLKLSPRLRNSMMGVAEYAGMKVSDADKQNLAEFATFRAKTIANFNLLLKEASGAAVTEQELRRMMMQEPNAEANGWFSRPDSPTEFMAKLNNSRTMLVSAIARKNYMMSEQGLKLDLDSVAKLTGLGRMPIGLDQMKNIMGKKQSEIERKIRIENPRIKPEELQPIVRNEMRGIFGI